MIKTTWIDPVTNKEYSYSWGFDVDGEHKRMVSYREVYTKRREEDEFMCPLSARGNGKIMASLKENLNMIYGTKSILEIINVIFNNPATIVFWSDGTKTVVKCQEGDVFDPEKGLAIAIVKKTYGNDNAFHKIFKTWVKEEDYEVPTSELIEDTKFVDTMNKVLDRFMDNISRK